MSFFKIGLNKYQNINNNGEELSGSEVLDRVDGFSSIVILYPGGELTNEEKIDRLKLNEALEEKLRGKLNIQIVADLNGVAITVKPAKVVFVFPVEYEWNAGWLMELASKYLGKGNVSTIDTLAKINFTDPEKLKAQISRYKSEGFVVLENIDT
jgi:hypothetical protein